MSVLVPGDRLPVRLEDESSAVTGSKKLVVGPGVVRKADHLLACKAGVLRTTTNPHTVWLDSHTRRYVPVRGDKVIGVVTGKAGDYFKVDIGSADIATVSSLSFEGATKRNRPNVKTGDLLYCSVLVAIKDLEPEVVCIDGEGKSRGLGVLPDGGFMFRCSLNLVRRLLSAKSSLLQTLGKDIQFEITCGINGRVWIKASQHKETVTLVRAISESELIPDSQIPDLIKIHIERLRGL